MAVDDRDEIARNFTYFETVVGELMPRYAGQYALLRDRAVVEVYGRPGEAMEAATSRFDDGRFSIQRVIDRPLDLGFLPYGSGDGAADQR